MKFAFLVAVAFLPLALSGCKRAVIEGQVVDAFGKPISDAVASVTGTQFTAHSDGSGKYSVGYVPGNITVAVSKPGFTDTSFSVSIATQSRYPAGPVILFEIPKVPEIFVISGGKYETLGKASLTQQTSSSSDGFGMSTDYTVFSVEYADFAAIPVLKAQDTPFVFVDNDPDNQTLFRIVREDGCNCLLTRIVQNGALGFAVGDFRDQAEIVREAYRSKNGLTLRTVSLPPGNYAFAPYNRRARSPILAGSIYVIRVE